jgi:hypothetical protein
MIAIETRTIIHAPIERCFDLARSIEVHLAANAPYGETTNASGLIRPGQSVTWRAKHFGLWQQLTSEITAMERPAFFRASMVKGIVRLMQQDHCFSRVQPNETEVRDIFRFAAPLPVLGRLAEIAVLRRYMARLLHERCAVIKRIAESNEWKRFLPHEN